MSPTIGRLAPARALLAALLAVFLTVGAGRASAQVRVDHGRHTRLQRFGRDVAYGAVEGLGFAAWDQYRNAPPEWGGGMAGYGRRVASRVGGFFIQEGITEGLAAELNRPLDYQRCTCSNTLGRIGHALQLSITDQPVTGGHPLAIPRIAGAYLGAFAESYWRPRASTHRASFVLGTGTTSLLLGAGVNLFHEFVR